ncbi:hypothetical protein GW17_00047932 [Ensete ventricosum]|nr:hypothetical protein GW17_00047932 [Ensete ventricosum]
MRVRRIARVLGCSACKRGGRGTRAQRQGNNKWEEKTREKETERDRTSRVYAAGLRVVSAATFPFGVPRRNPVRLLTGTSFFSSSSSSSSSPARVLATAAPSLPENPFVVCSPNRFLGEWRYLVHFSILSFA